MKSRFVVAIFSRKNQAVAVMSHIKTVLFNDEETQHLRKLYPSLRQYDRTYLRTVQGDVVLYESYEKFKGRLKNWQIFQDDVYLLCFPKSGSTWAQELVWCVKNNCDMETAKAVPLDQRFPYLEMPLAIDHLSSQSASTQDPFSVIENTPRPRMFKSHLPFRLLPDDLLANCKVVVCIRNPKDTVVSYYHFEQQIKVNLYEGDFATYFDLFMDNKVRFGPYFDQVVEAWKRRDDPNLCLLIYEDMKKDLAGSVRKVAKFFDKDLSDEQVEMLVQHLSFDKMKENPAVNGEILRNVVLTEKGGFMRKGLVGDWKNHFTEEMNKRMDEAIEKYFKPIGLSFLYEL